MSRLSGENPPRAPRCHPSEGRRGRGLGRESPEVPRASPRKGTARSDLGGNKHKRYGARRIRTRRLSRWPAEEARMELGGARSNPRLEVELSRLGAIHERLLRKAAANPNKPRSSPPRHSPVLETITCVLERSDRPMRVREIHTAAEKLSGQPLRWTSVKGALAEHASSSERRFRRVRRGVYEIAGAAKQVAGPR
jgi:hypothetical protein